MIKSLLRKFLPKFLINWYHFGLAFLAAALYGFSGRKLKIIGVTGTNGKTTVVELTARVLAEAGFRVAFLSSIRFKIGEKEWPNKLKMTMPGRFFIQKFLRRAAMAGCQYAILEVTSEGILQHRHRFINFEAAVFTNLSPEHIERHGGFENYKKAKGKLFEAAKNIHIINIDDKNAAYFWHFPARKKYGYKLSDYPDLKIKLLGEFNKYNAIAAISIGLSQGIDLAVCKKAVEEFKGIPGRMELVISEPFRVFVDYAFTPNALEKVYQTIKPRICVLGACGGGRDKWKRRVLGGIAGKYCENIIITDEDPYDEDPLEIMNQIESGFSKIQNPKSKIQKILDRREAINTALKLAKPGDTVVITGKGCEPWMCVAGGKKIPWDDRQVVKEEFSLTKI